MTTIWKIYIYIWKISPKKGEGITLRYENHHENLTKNFTSLFVVHQNVLNEKNDKKMFAQKDWMVQYFVPIFSLPLLKRTAFVHFIINRHGHNLKQRNNSPLEKKNLHKKSTLQDAEFGANE